MLSQLPLGPIFCYQPIRNQELAHASTWIRPNHMAHDIVISCKQVVLNNLSLTENVWHLPKVV